MVTWKWNDHYMASRARDVIVSFQIVDGMPYLAYNACYFW
jgi:hypothetical protein